MTQIISLSDNFINDILGGDSFLLAVSSSQDVFFVDDSLDSIQINSMPIESLAILGTKILGLSATVSGQEQSLFEWSTAGFNKLSFNKENKILMKQDFQIREFRLKKEFNQQPKLCNLSLSKNSAALIFDDAEGVDERFRIKMKKNFDEDAKDDNEPKIDNSTSKLVIAEFVCQGVKQSHVNPLIALTDSSLNSSRDYDLDNLAQSRFEPKPEHIYMEQPQPKASPSTVQNHSYTQSMINNRLAKENKRDLIEMDGGVDGSFRMQESILEVRNEEIAGVGGNFGGVEKKQIKGEGIEANTGSSVNMNQQFKANNQISANQFFFDCDQQAQNQAGIPLLYRPSSIKSFKMSQNKSQSSFNNNSSPSLKQCAAEMLPLERNSKIEISFPSFLTLSNELHKRQPLHSTEKESPLDDRRSQKENINPMNNNYQFSIKIKNTSPHESLPPQSRETSIIREQSEDSEKREESLIVTFDSFRIKAMQTTTPRRLLGGYSMNKRSFTSVTPSEKNPIMNPSNSKSQLSSQQSELSNEFNLTTQSCRTKEGAVGRNTIASNFRGEQQVHLISSGKQGLTSQQQMETTNKKLSNSCGASNRSKKRAHFIKAILEQSKPKNHFEIPTNQTSVTQIYSAPPFKDDSKKKDAVREHISEEDVNMVMSSSEGQNSHIGQRQFNIFGMSRQEEDEKEEDQELAMEQSQLPRHTLTVPQTEDNLEVEYTVSHSCTPQSNNSSSNIKRRINFDDTSGGQANAFIRMSESTNNNRMFAKFKLTIGNNSGFIDGRSMGGKGSLVGMNNGADQSASFMFNQCDSPPPVQPFKDENNPMSNIKSNSTPSIHENTTHILMMTEEKFKNLKSEISQNEQQNQQYLISQNTLLSSPMLNDYTLLNKIDSKSMLLNNQLNISNLQNLSGFIKQNKYLQVYENFRRAFMTLCKLKDLKRAHAFRHIKKVTADARQRKEFMQGMARFLMNTLRNHMVVNQQVGFKRIKKFYKEKQLQVYIRRKQNEFAMKTSVLVKIDSIICTHNQEDVKFCFTLIKLRYEQIKKQVLEKQRKSAMILFNFLHRKSKNIQEKTLRTITNLVNEKKILEMQVKMLSRVLIKIVGKKVRHFYSDLKDGIAIMERRKIALYYIEKQTLRNEFKRFKQEIMIKKSKQVSCEIQQHFMQNYQLRNQLRRSFQLFKSHTLKARKAEENMRQMSSILLKKIMTQTLTSIKQYARLKQQKEKSLKVQKALLLLLFSKLQDLQKQKLRLAFKSISSLSKPEETMMIGKSLTSGNLSMSLNSLGNDASLGNTRNQLNHEAFYSNDLTKRKLSLNPQQNPLGKSYNQHPKNLQTNRVSDKASLKPTLNDYLSFSPKNFEQLASSKEINKFQIRRKTESNTARPQFYTKAEKGQMDCPLPLKQQTQREPELRSRNNQSLKQSSTNKLNVSIKDLNKAFKNEISKIKEKQDDSNFEKDSLTSSNNQTQQILDQKDSDYDVSQTREVFNLTHEQSSYLCENTQQQSKIKVNENLKTRSPQINPLCTSESYYQMHAQQNCINPQFYVSQEGPRYSNQHAVPIPKSHNASYATESSRGNYLKVPFQLKDMNLYQPSQSSLDSMPKTSTFGQIKNDFEDQNENVNESSESKFSIINKTDMPLTFREQQPMVPPPLQPMFTSAKSRPAQAYGTAPQSSHRKKSDTRYQRLSYLEQDFSMDFDQSHNMFDEFDVEEREQQIIRLQCANNVGMSMTKTSLADLSRKLDLTSILGQDCSQDNMGANFMYSQQEQLSPKFSESFLPHFNREVLNELAANFQMMELTPETDLKMLLHNKSLFNREESIYSTTQYADPVELGLSPRNNQLQPNEYRGVTHQQQPTLISFNPNLNPQPYSYMYTNSSQVNYYQNTQNSQNYPLSKEIPSNQESSEYYDTEQDEMCDNDSDDCEERAYTSGNGNNSLNGGNWVIQRDEYDSKKLQEESRPYDFELSSNSKYKIISENDKIKKVLRSEISKPSLANSISSNICKKISFGNENLGTRNNTLGNPHIQSAGAYTNRTASLSKLVTQTQQVYNQKERSQQMRTMQGQQVRATQSNQGVKSNNNSGLVASTSSSQDFISQNIQRLRNMVKPAPRY